MQRATDGVGRVLEAVGAASGIIRALQQHYATVVEPRVEAAPAEATACATGLAALVRAVERQVLTALQAALSAFFAQAGPAAPNTTFYPMTSAVSPAGCPVSLFDPG